MKFNIFFFSLLAVTSLLSGISDKQDDYLESRNSQVHFIGPWYGLFLASINCVLNHIWWCEKNNRIPVVYWDSRSPYYNSQGFNGKRNAWEYYFEPVSDINPTPPRPPAMKFTPTTPDTVIFSHRIIDQPKRHLASEFIKKYIKIRPVIMHKIDRFYVQNMEGKHTIAIHLRGTDKGREERLIPPEKIIPVALKYARPDTQFLLASDEERLMKRMIQLLHGRKVIYYDCYRSPNSGNPVLSKKPKPSRGQMGEDVLVEVSLMARSDMLIHTLSNVSSAALYFNPDLEHVTVRQAGLTPIAHQNYIVTRYGDIQELMYYF